MALRNRVDPFGALCATRDRGTLFGNRGGCFHTPDKRARERPWASRQWICCVLSFKNRRRQVWTKGYTELFFLDEVTALAAGHRPCFECRRADAKAFQAAWRGAGVTRAPEMDRRLHAERLDGCMKRMHLRMVRDLPDGVMIARGGRAFALRGGAMLEWSFAGYGAAAARPRGKVSVLTPPAIIECLERGYQPLWHASSGNSAASQSAGPAGRTS